MSKKPDLGNDFDCTGVTASSESKAYYVKSYKDDIVVFDRARWTAKTVTITGKWPSNPDKDERSPIVTESGRYFKTEAEAKAYLVERAQGELKRGQAVISRAEDTIKRFSP